MAAPNIVAVSTIRGKSNVANLTTTSSSVIVNDVNSGKVFKINTIMISNVDGSAAGNVTVERFKFGAQNTSTGTGNATITASTYVNIANGGTAGQSYTTVPLSGFGSPFNPTLSSNSGTLEWSFNLRTNRNSIFSGFLAAGYGGAVVLASTTTNLQNAGNGYALVYGSGGTRNWRFVRYTGGLSGTQTTIVTGGIFSGNTNYVSARITYVPTTNTWSYYFRDDGPTVWGDPTTVSTLIGSVVDSTYTSSLMSSLGVFFNYSTGANQNLQFDNLRVLITG